MFGMFGAFNPRFYPKVARQSIGKSIGFILVFALIISALVSIKYTFVVRSGLSVAKGWIHENMPRITAEFPVITVDKGVLVEPKQEFIREYQKQFAVIVEPDADKVQPIMDKYSNLALLTSRQLITKQTMGNGGSADIKTYNLENKSFTIAPGADGFKVSFEQRQFDLTPKMVNHWLDIIAMVIFPVLLILWFVVYCFTKPLHVFILSLVSLILTAILKTKLPYKQIWNIGVYALVPATCVAALMDIVGLRILFFPLIYCAISSIYLYLGIQATSVEQTQAKK